MLSNKKWKMRLIGIEPTHAAPEATALSTELQTHLLNHTTFEKKMQGFYFAGTVRIRQELTKRQNRSDHERC